MTNGQRTLIRVGHLAADLIDVAFGLAILGVIAAALGGCSVDMQGLDAKARLGDGASDDDVNTPDASVPDVKTDTGIDVVPLRPLGAGCTTSEQCASNTCAKNPGDSSGMCCDHPNDSCNACVGGYSTPLQDGTKCGGGLCDGVPPFINQISCRSTNHVCSAGACLAVTIDCCATTVCEPGHNARCSGVAADLNQPSFCTVCV
jgi:hypothetical protein